jgi:lysophospholipase L1-like esterase
MNINPSSKRILCFGDSNTWGYISGSKQNRHPSDIRWTGVLQKALGYEYEIIEEGLNSRGIVKGDGRPGKEGRSAIEYIIPCLDSHDPLDYVIVFLGTNELKSEHNLSAIDVGENLRILINIINSRNSQVRDPKPKVIIVVPPSINDQTAFCVNGGKFVDSNKKSIELKNVYKTIADETSSQLLDIQNDMKTGEDGVHMLIESHELLGNKLADLVK